jgi:pectinesterase
MKTSICILIGASIVFLTDGVSFAAEKQITVAADSSGDFKTVQEAIAAAPDKSAERTIIHIKSGTYQGHFIVPKNKINITLKGEATETTILTWDKNVNDPKPEGSNKFNPGFFVQGNDCCAENLTIQNTAGDRGQALAVRVDADRIAFKHCRLLGWQDTLMINNGRQYFKDCYIEGRVDFIYGSGMAVFENCTIHSKNGGYITAASTPQEKPYGFVFLNCKLTGDDKPWTNPAVVEAPKVGKKPNALLGRPWRPYASVAFINCEIGDHIKPEGWSNWGKVENESTARFAEYGNKGPGATLDKRAPWTKLLSKAEADKITVQSVLAGSDNWKPE